MKFKNSLSLIELYYPKSSCPSYVQTDEKFNCSIRFQPNFEAPVYITITQPENENYIFNSFYNLKDVTNLEFSLDFPGSYSIDLHISGFGKLNIGHGKINSIHFFF